MMPPLLSHYLETLGFLGSELGSIAAVAGIVSSSLLSETIAQLRYHLTSTHTQTSHFPQHIHTLHHSISLLDNNNIVFFVKRTSETAAAVGAGAKLDSSISALSSQCGQAPLFQRQSCFPQRSPVLTLSNI